VTPNADYGGTVPFDYGDGVDRPNWAPNADLVGYLQGRANEARRRSVGFMGLPRTDEIGSYWAGMADAFQEAIVIIEAPPNGRSEP
jgi:hypothetical protein